MVRSLALGLAVAAAACQFDGSPIGPGAGATDARPDDPGQDGAAISDASPDDGDGDGVADADDNCPEVPNASQADEDGDEVGNACDRCPADADDQSDADGDGVGDACDPQSAQMNTLLFFEGFDGPLDLEDWPGAADWTVEGGALIQPDNNQRYYLRRTGIDASDNIQLVGSVEFSNPLGFNGVAFRFGGIFVEGDDEPSNNGCWLVRSLSQNTEGYSLVNVDDGSPAGALVQAALLEDTSYRIAVSVGGAARRCAIEPAGEGPTDFTGSAPNYANQDLGVVASFTEMRVAYLYAIRLQ